MKYEKDEELLLLPTVKYWKMFILRIIRQLINNDLPNITSN